MYTIDSSFIEEGPDGGDDDRAPLITTLDSVSVREVSKIRTTEQSSSLLEQLKVALL